MYLYYFSDYRYIPKKKGKTALVVIKDEKPNEKSEKLSRTPIVSSNLSPAGIMVDSNFGPAVGTSVAASSFGPTITNPRPVNPYIANWVMQQQAFQLQNGSALPVPVSPGLNAAMAQFVPILPQGYPTLSRGSPSNLAQSWSPMASPLPPSQLLTPTKQSTAGIVTADETAHGPSQAQVLIPVPGKPGVYRASTIEQLAAEHKQSALVSGNEASSINSSHQHLIVNRDAVITPNAPTVNEGPGHGVNHNNLIAVKRRRSSEEPDTNKRSDIMLPCVSDRETRSNKRLKTTTMAPGSCSTASADCHSESPRIQGQESNSSLAPISTIIGSLKRPHVSSNSPNIKMQSTLKKEESCSVENREECELSSRATPQGLQPYPCWTCFSGQPTETNPPSPYQMPGHGYYPMPCHHHKAQAQQDGFWNTLPPHYRQWSEQAHHDVFKQYQQQQFFPFPGQQSLPPPIMPEPFVSNANHVLPDQLVYKTSMDLHNGQPIITQAEGPHTCGGQPVMFPVWGSQEPAFTTGAMADEAMAGE